MEPGKFFSGWQIILLRHTGDFQKSVLLVPPLVDAVLMGRIPPAPPGFFRLGESLHSVEVMGVYFSKTLF